MTGPNHYKIRWQDSFDLRRPVLETIRHSVRWQVSDDQSVLILENPISEYRPHERELLAFALDPYDIAERIFERLDIPAQQNLSIAIMNLFGPAGFLRPFAETPSNEMKG